MLNLKIKKIRGLKRKFKLIEKWKQNSIYLNRATLDIDEIDYVKLWIRPWYRLEPLDPPQGFKREMFKSLVDIFKSWNESLTDIENKYLAIWIDDNVFMDSQVVTALNSRIDYYNRLDGIVIHSESLGLEKKFPKLKSIIQEFDWKLVKDYMQTTESDFVGSVEEYATIEDFNSTKKQFEFLKQNILIHSYKDDSTSELIYVFETGCRWVGTLSQK